ncbi:hypothetical protein [Micromonospora parathelypteridis]|uniref:Uncharacterized protein n=1 Tax=Micromonospora parathelypteridis TaxID=1839617 RepID=A0A840VY80_9ACTN|nr:hypothetical protein [Micromonospora parathelypteridis]MBB5475961.1 hypothetical protein [Micromonospora parathelypteridis]GGO32190.1 hypothetical protein GCM10011576_62180 [Micromonospora parathelypteridis]
MKRAALYVIAGPVGIAAYGLVRLWGKSDGVYGPGFDWQAAHLVALAGMVFFVPGVLTLARLLPPSPWRTGVVVLTLVGLAATMVQFGADIVEGLLAEDRAEMSALSADFKDIPGVEVAFYDVVPQLFFLGLVVLAGMLAAKRRLPWWSAPLLLVGIVLPVVTLDLLPIGGLCMLVALSPALRTVARQDERATSPVAVH